MSFLSPGTSIHKGYNLFLGDAGSVTDKYFNNVALLLLLKGAAGTQQIVDSSRFANVPVINGAGGVLTNDFSPFVGGNSFKPFIDSNFPALDTQVFFGRNANFGIAPNTSLTFEVWIYSIAPANFTAAPIIWRFDKYDAGNNFIGYDDLYNLGNTPSLVYGVSGSDPFYQSAYTGNNWHFISVTKDGITGAVSYSIDGVLMASTIHAGFFNCASAQIYFGSYTGGNGGNNTNYRIGPMRFTIGVNRYPTGNYAVPSANFPSS